MVSHENFYSVLNIKAKCVNHIEEYGGYSGGYRAYMSIWREYFRPFRMKLAQFLGFLLWEQRTEGFPVNMSVE